MARETFPVEVLTPEGEVFNDEVEMLSTRTTEGSIGVLAKHAPLMAMLDPTELRLYKSESDIVKFAQGEGYLQVVENSALVLVEEAIAPDELDRADLEEKLKEARARLERTEPPEHERDEGTAPRSLAAPERRRATEERRRAENDLKRYEAFLELASGESS
jgi:F-type H+-transporting ATPase subunit epsilon